MRSTTPNTKLHSFSKRTSSKSVGSNKHLKQSEQEKSTVDDSCFPSLQSEHHTRSKRKREPDFDHSSEPLHKNACLKHTVAPSNSIEATLQSNLYGSEVEWGDYFATWPPKVSDPPSNKRKQASSQPVSYTQRVRNGESPPAWTSAHAANMIDAGLFMDHADKSIAITEGCRKLCNRLLKAAYPLAEGPSFHLRRLSSMTARFHLCNEARICRDLTPIIVPSPELLHVDGAQLDDICELLNTEWNQCDTLCGPKPKPDMVVGISGSAFTDEEKVKLQLSHTTACPNRFPEYMYFPFLICEVNDSDMPIDEAEWQAMHAASIAVRAVIRLFEKVSATAEIERKILAFSVAHNHSYVKIFGHFATIKDGKISFFRHKLHEANFTPSLVSAESTKAYNIVRAIYDRFFPIHLKRIRSTLAKIPSQTLASVTSQLGTEEELQNSTGTLPPSQEGTSFKRRSLPSTSMLQRQNDRLLDMLQAQIVTTERQLTELKEQMERQLTEQREQMERQLTEQKERMERQSTEQKGWYCSWLSRKWSYGNKRS